MNKNLRNIDKLFRSAIDEHEENPPANVWDKIQKGLDEEKTEGPASTSLIKRLAVVAACLIIAGGVFALYTQYYKASKSSPQQTAARTRSGSRSNTQPGTAPREQAVANDRTAQPLTALKDSSSLTSAKSKSAEAITVDDNAVNISAALPGTIEPHQNALYNGLTQRNTIRPLTYRQHANNAGQIVRMAGKTDHEQANRIGWTPPSSIAGLSSPRVFTALSSQELTGNSFSMAAFLNRTVAGNDSSLTALIKAFLLQRKQSKERNSHVTLGIFFAPSISGRGVKDNDDRLPRRPGTNRDEIEQGEKRTLNLSTGLLLNYQIGSRWTIGSGIFDVRSVLNISPKKLYAEHDDQGRVRYRFNCTGGYSYIDPQSGPAPAAGDSIYSSSSKTITNYVGIPLTLKYTMGSGRLRFSPTVGLAANFLTGSKLVTALSVSPKGGTATPVSGLASVYFNGLVAFEADYQVGNRVSLFFEPGYTFSVTPSTINMPVRTFPKSIGFSVGTQFRL